MNSVDREHPVLLGAVVIRLIGADNDDKVDVEHFVAFTDAMASLGYSTEDCYHILEDIEAQYYRNS